MRDEGYGGKPTVHAEGRFRGSSGADLYCGSWTPLRSKASVAIVHGVGEHSGRYRHVAEFLAARSYSVYAYDHRGHGRSSGPRGHIDNFRDYTDDLGEYLKTFPDTKRVILLGHSLGGLIAVRFAIEHPGSLGGLVVSSPALGLSLRVPPAIKAAISITSLLYPGFRITDNVIKAEDLSHDPGIVRLYDSDPLITRIRTSRSFTEMMRAQKMTMKEAGSLEADCLILRAGADKVVSNEAIAEFFEKAGSKHKRLLTYEGFYHELFNETENSRVLSDVASWLDSITAGLPPSGQI